MAVLINFLLQVRINLLVANNGCVAVLTSCKHVLCYSQHVYLQISVFVAVLGLDSKRMASYYFNVRQLTEVKEDNHESILFWLIRRYYAPFLLHKYIRILVVSLSYILN